MKTQNLIYWIFAAFAALFGMLVTGLGIYLLVRGQNCGSYADLGCAFGLMSSFIIIPYGLVNLSIVGVASLPFKAARAIGSIFAILSGLANAGFCCVTSLWTFSSDGSSLLAGDTGVFFLLGPFAIFLGGVALIGVGAMGYQMSKQ